VSVPRRFLYMYMLAEGGLVLSALFFGWMWLVNTQVAFFCSLAITVGTFLSYRRMVKRRLEAGAYVLEEEEEKEPDDPHGLWKEESTSPPLDVKTMIEEEKERQKQEKKGLLARSHLSSALPSFLFPYRLLGYVALIVGFLVLRRHEMFEVVPFVIGLGVVPLTALLTLLVLGKGR